EDFGGGAYAVTVLLAILGHGTKGIDGLPDAGLQALDRAADQFAAGLAVGRLKLGVLQPAAQRRLAHAGLFRRGRACRFGEQSGDCRFLRLEFFAATAHWRSPALISWGLRRP